MNEPAGLAVTRLSDLEALRRIEHEWTELLRRQLHATPFQRPEWLLAWIESFRPRELWVLEVRANKRLVGIAPLFGYRSEAGGRVLALLGVGISDYLDFTVDPAHAREVLQAIFDFLERYETEWDQVELLDLPDQSPLLMMARPRREWHWQSAQHDICPKLVLPAEVDDWRRVIPSRQRRNLNTAVNRIRRAGKIRVTVADRSTLAEHLRALLQLHGARWRESGKPGVLANGAVREFHWKSAPSLLEAGVLRLYGLRLDDELIAALYTLWESDTVYFYLQGFDTLYAEFSPGMQIVAAVIQEALRERKKIIDFLRGREAYKYLWGTRDYPTFRVVLRRSGENEAVSSGADAA
jgi:CelD/BcsL family acetyltransferase involved in cellulose biosynthesis